MKNEYLFKWKCATHSLSAWVEHTIVKHYSQSTLNAMVERKIATCATTEIGKIAAEQDERNREKKM